MTDPRRMAEDFVRELRGALQDHVQSALLFGSAARGEWIEGVSDVNVLVLLDDIDAPLLGRAAGVSNAAVARGVRPLLMELDEWRRAADVFTIELTDMKDASSPVFGDDPVADARVETSILRLQAEREMRAKLLHLHAGMLVAAQDRKRLGQLFVHALPSFMTYMRTALRLAGQSVPLRSAELIEQACSLVDGATASADGAAYTRVLDARTSGAALAVSLDEPLANEFNTAAERLAAYIDAFGR